MKYYEYDSDNWLIGWHEEPDRPNSTTIEPTVPPAYARWNGSEWIEDTSTRAEKRKVRLDAAWADANKHAQQMDNNSRTSLLWVYYDPATSQTCKDMIIAVQVWWNNVWIEYARVKALIEAGQDVKYDASVVGDCPYTIWQINGSR